MKFQFDLACVVKLSQKSVTLLDGACALLVPLLLGPVERGLAVIVLHRQVGLGTAKEKPKGASIYDVRTEGGRGG